MIKSIFLAFIFMLLINWSVSLQVSLPSIKEQNVRKRIIGLISVLSFVAGIIILI